MILKVKKLANEATLPVKAHDTDAGFDFVATRFTQEIDKSGKLIIVYHTDISMEIPKGYVGLIFMRSSVCEKSLTLTNAVGVIDSGYRGEVIAKFKLTTDAIPTIYQPGDKIFQLVIIKLGDFSIKEATDLEDSDRGENGYGSTDENTNTENK